MLAPKRSHPNVTLAVLAVGGLAYALLQSLVSPALPTIQHDLHTSETGVTWVLTGYLLSAAVTTPILGRLGDIYGKRRMLIITLAILAAGTLMAAIATSLGMLVAGRVIQGVGGGIFPLAFGIIRDEFPRDKVAGSIGLVSALLGLGGGFGVVLAGVIIDHLSYHYLFWLPLIAVVASLLATVRFIPESPNTAPGRINFGAATLMSIGLAAVLLAVSETTTWGWGSAKTLGLIAFGSLVLFAWVRAELASDDPLVDMRMMGIRGVWTTNLAAVMLGAGMYIAFILIPQFVQTSPKAGFGFGSSVVAGGAFLLPMSLVMLLVGSFAGRLEQRIGSKPPVVAGAVFTLIAFIVLITEHSSKLPIYIASGLAGVGIGLAFAAMANLIVHAVRPDQTGVATGMNTVARSLGGAFGAQLAATFIANSTGASGFPTISGYKEAFAVGIVAMIIAIAAGLTIPGRISDESALVLAAQPA